MEGSIFYFDKNNEIIKDFRSISYVPQTINLPANNIFDCLAFTNPKLKNFQTNEKIQKFILKVLESCKIWGEFIFSYEWSKGDICLWDNLSILHMASEIKNCRRVMHRITMK